MCPWALFLFQVRQDKLSFTCQPRKALSVKGYAHNLYDLYNFVFVQAFISACAQRCTFVRMFTRSSDLIYYPISI